MGGYASGLSCGSYDAHTIRAEEVRSYPKGQEFIQMIATTVLVNRSLIDSIVMLQAICIHGSQG